MEEQRGFVEQPFRRFDALDDDAARHGVQLGILAGRQFAPGEHHDRHVGQRRLAAHAFQHLEARHVGQAEVEDHAIAGPLPQDFQRLLAGAGIDDLDVVVAEQLADAHLLGGIVLDHQQAAAARLREVLDLAQGVGDAFARRRLGDERERPARQPVLAIFVERDDLHGDMAGKRILLELAEHIPAEHVGQEDVERDCGRLILLGEIERVVAAHGEQHLEALVAGEVEQDAGVMRIILDDEQDAVAGLDFQPVVGNLLDGAFHRHHRRRHGACRHRPRRRG